MTDRLDIVYRALGRPVDHEALLERLIAEVNTPWFSGGVVQDEVTVKVVQRCHQVLWEQRGHDESTTVMSLIRISRLWTRQARDMRESPVKHLLRWNATLIQSALLDAFA